jgi:hypothetical protein
LNLLDTSDQTSTEKILEEEERILQNVVETKGKIKVYILFLTDYLILLISSFNGCG